MSDQNINFMDIVCLQRITPDTVLEKFGGIINASFFDASNIAGTLKQKGLIDFSANYPGPNGIIITDAGKGLLEEASGKSGEALDALDDEILAQVAGGKRMPFELAKSINIADKDLAFRLYKLSKQNLIIYELKNGGVDIILSEAGFLKAKELPTMIKREQDKAEGAKPEQAPVTQIPGIEKTIIVPRKKRSPLVVAGAVVAVAVVAYGAAVFFGLV